MATWHIAADPVLCTDIAALAATVSSSIITFLPSRRQLQGARNEAKAIQPLPTLTLTHANNEPNQFELIQSAGVDKDSRVVTLVIPHDVSRGPSGCVDVKEVAEEAMAAMCGRGEGGSREFVLIIRPCLNQNSFAQQCFVTHHRALNTS